jgi:methylthioribulose-1-phosphate dehydratase
VCENGGVLTRRDTADAGETARQLCELASACYARGWAVATSGNFSAVVARDPLRVLISPSGAHKGALAPESLIQIDQAGAALEGYGQPSAETHVHLALVRARGAGAVAHTHSVWSTLLSESEAAQGGLRLEGYEMLKALQGVETHAHAEWLPIVANTQDWRAGARDVEAALRAHPAAHGFLIRGHGLYAWGRDVAEARRHVEALEFLLEVHGRRTWRS